MILSDISIRRPITAIVISVLLLIFGVVALSRLTVRELPNISEPAISIVTTYTGATPSIIENKITKPIEDELSGIAGIKSINSTSRSGRSWIGIDFNADKDMLEAISDVRDAVARAKKKLPKDADDPIATRDNGEGEVVLWLTLSSNLLDRGELSELAKNFVQKPLSLLDGISQVNLIGAQEKVMYVYLKPDEMNSLGITVDDIISAIGYENIELPSGQISNKDMLFPVQVHRAYVDEESFGKLPIRRIGFNDIRLQDVAKIKFDAKNGNSIYHRNGISSIGIGVIPQSTANRLDISKNVRARVKQLAAQLPNSVNLEVDFDSSIYIENSINEVTSTLVMTAILIIAVLYFFIGSWKVTLIPALTVPISLIASFIGAYIFNSSINIITLLSLILAIGLVVDDAIVMVENISYHLKTKSLLQACFIGAKEVGFAIISTTVVLVMIFIPLVFVDGITGKILAEFALLLSLAVVCSSLIALTLAPALASLGLISSGNEKSFILKLILKIMHKLEEYYGKAINFMFAHSYIYPSILIFIIGFSAILYSCIPHQMAPHEDRGVIYIYASGEEGSSIHRMKRNMSIIEERLLPYIDEHKADSISFSTPASGTSSEQSGFVVMQLVDWSKRKFTSKELVKEIKTKLNDIPDLKIHVYEPGFKGATGSPIRYVLKGDDYKVLNDAALRLIKEASQNMILINAEPNYVENTPEIDVTIDIAKASVLGASLKDISKALQTYLGGVNHTTFVHQGEEYDVYLRANEEDFADLNAISSLTVRTNTGDMIPLGSIADFKIVAKSKRLPHFDRQKAIIVRGHPHPSVSIGESLAWLDNWCSKNLDPSISVDVTGQSRNFKESEKALTMVLSLSLVVTFLVLAAQFESIIYPIVVMVTVPLGVVGGLFGVWLYDQSLNIYSQIGLLLLIGMVTKNGILMVEYANQLRVRGYELRQAIETAAIRRLRPIIMTSITAIVGAIPLLIANGSGYESRQAVGVVIFFGMSFSTLITLLILPSIYYFLGRFSKVQSQERLLLNETPSNSETQYNNE